LDRPLALSVSHLLSQKKQGLTATELAEELRMSVPTLYRLTLEMHQLRLLVNEKHGRKNVFKISPSAERLLSSAYTNAKKILESKPSKIDQLSMTKEIIEEMSKVSEVDVIFKCRYEKDIKMLMPKLLEHI